MELASATQWILNIPLAWFAVDYESALVVMEHLLIVLLKVIVFTYLGYLLDTGDDLPSLFFFCILYILCLCIAFGKYLLVVLKVANWQEDKMARYYW